ncbi:MAG: ribbon-helix-helix domain-containing protein [Acidimicrobiales bacterium]
MPKSIQEILDHAREFAQRFENYEPKPGDERPGEELLLQRAALALGFASRWVATCVGLLDRAAPGGCFGQAWSETQTRLLTGDSWIVDGNGARFRALIIWDTIWVMARREVLVQLDDDLVEQLDALAADLGTNRSELMRRGAQAVLDAERLATADRELRAAYRRVPADPALVQSARRLAAETTPAW